MANEAVERDEMCKTECHQVCATLLRCSGQMPNESVIGLSKLMFTKMESVKEEVESYKISPHIALLCLWGKTDDISISLAKSISKGFGRKNIFGNDSTLFTEESLDSSRKRKQSKASGSSVPSLPPRVALCVISRILQGFDPSCRAARECMMKSDVGSTALLNALEDSHHHAEEILRVNQVS